MFLSLLLIFSMNCSNHKKIRFFFHSSHEWTIFFWLGNIKNEVCLDYGFQFNALYRLFFFIWTKMVWSKFLGKKWNKYAYIIRDISNKHIEFVSPLFSVDVLCEKCITRVKFGDSQSSWSLTNLPQVFGADIKIVSSDNWTMFSYLLPFHATRKWINKTRIKSEQQNRMKKNANQDIMCFKWKMLWKRMCFL